MHGGSRAGEKDAQRIFQARDVLAPVLIGGVVARHQGGKSVRERESFLRLLTVQWSGFTSWEAGRIFLGPRSAVLGTVKQAARGLGRGAIRAFGRS